MADILVVDDQKTARDLVGSVVSSLGHKAFYAEDGEQCVQQAKSLKPKLILLDVVMPKLDGFGALREMKKDPDLAAIPVVLVTTKGTAADKFWGQRNGAVDHVVKPFTPADLAAVIKKHT